MAKRAMTDKIFLFGETGGTYQRKAKLQNFYELRDKHLKEKTLFEDETFPADNTSLYFSQGNNKKRIAWRRPKEIHPDAKLFIEGHTRFDAVQGDCKNCWVVASIANLANYEGLLHFLIPPDQDFGEKYAGIFHFRFWQYGKWVDIVIDDRLPYHKGKGMLFNLRSRQKNEFWSPLIEKAYAKLHGSYEALADGYALDAMQDFTGGISEVLRFPVDPTLLYESLRKGHERSSLLTCALRLKMKSGLIGGHAYSITCIRTIKLKDSSEEINLIRLRNPWGNFEWKGAWSDGSPEWDSVSEETKQSLEVCEREEGEFWMSFEDFERNYVRVEICNLSPLPEIGDKVDAGERGWKISYFEGKWVKDVTAGGRSCFQSTFCHNPQYRVTVTKTDEGETECTLIVGLLQKFRRQQRHLGVKNLAIAYEMYRIDNPETAPTPLDIDFFSKNEPVIASPNHVVLREFTRKVKVPPGSYCIVPCTHDPNQEGEFLIRVFSEQEHKFEEHDEPLAYEECVSQDVIKLCSANKETRKTDQATELFTKYAGDVGTINWNKLKIILDSVLAPDKKTVVDFPKDVCRSLLAMLDRDRSGELSLDEFQLLWTDVQRWKNVFQMFDEDNSGTLDSFELRKALNSVGFRVNFSILNLLMQRYANQKRQLELEDFITCAVKLKTMIDIFNEHDQSGKKSATFSLDQWIENTLYT